MNKETKIGLYWAAKEVAKQICKDNYPETIDESVYLFAIETQERHQSWLAQELKKLFIAVRKEQDDFNERYGWFLIYDDLSKM